MVRRTSWSTNMAKSYVDTTVESRFTLDFHDGRIRVHRLPGERFEACCIKEHDRYGEGSIMLWAGIWYGGRHQIERHNDG